MRGQKTPRETYVGESGSGMVSAFMLVSFDTDVHQNWLEKEDSGFPRRRLRVAQVAHSAAVWCNAVVGGPTFVAARPPLTNASKQRGH